MTGLHKELGPRPGGGASVCAAHPLYISIHPPRTCKIDLLAKETCHMLPHPCVPSVVPRAGYSELETTVFFEVACRVVCRGGSHQRVSEN